MRVILILSLVVTGMCGCSKRADFGCAESLKNRITIGVPMDTAEAAVKECGLEYSLDRSAKVLHAIRREKKRMTQESRVILITFDQSDKVSSIEVKPAYTGL